MTDVSCIFMARVSRICIATVSCNLYGNYQLHMCMGLGLLLHMYGSMYAVMVATATVLVAVRVQRARTSL
jgi:hypothetical protein